MKLRGALVLFALPFPLAALTGACGGATALDVDLDAAPSATSTVTGSPTATTTGSPTTTATPTGTPPPPPPPPPVPDASPPPPDGAPPPPLDAGPPPVDAAPDASPDASFDAGSACVSGPVERALCTPGTDVACNRSDLCCSATKYECDATTSRWKKVPAGILCFACLGTPCGGRSCMGSQFCLERVGPGGSRFACLDYPAACSDDWTCGCMTAAAPPGCGAPTCRENPTSHVQMRCQTP